MNSNYDDIPLPKPCRQSYLLSEKEWETPPLCPPERLNGHGSSTVSTTNDINIGRPSNQNQMSFASYYERNAETFSSLNESQGGPFNHANPNAPVRPGPKLTLLKRKIKR